MKYIKKYSIYLESDDVNIDNDLVNKSSISDIQKSISYYNSKKQVMMDVFKDIKKSDDDINKDLISKVYSNDKDVKNHNKYLVNLESIYRLKRNMDKVELNIEEDNIRKSDTQRQLNDLSDRLSQVDSKEKIDLIKKQIDSSKNYIKKLDSNITNSKSEISKLSNSIKLKKEDFDKFIKIEMDKISKL